MAAKQGGIDGGQGSKSVRMTSARHPLAAFFAPRAVAMIGATDKSFWSQEIFRNFEVCGFEGKIYMVNKRGAPAHGHPGFCSCRDIGAKVDAAYIFVPIEAVFEALRDAAAAGIKHIVVLTSGFAEVESGKALQAALLALADELGVTLFGPNSLGFVNLAAKCPLSAIRIMPPVLPPAIAVVSQSGASSVDLFDFAQQQNIGISFIAATGNEGRIGLADIVDYLVDDPATKAIAVFAETIRDPRKFTEAAARARRAAKPIVVLKIGRSELAGQVALAHTGSLVGDDKVFAAACRRFGVIRVGSFEDLILTAGLLAHTGPLQKPGIGVVSLSGGACTLVADIAAETGVALPPLAPATIAALRGFMPDFASTLNPLDITGAALREPSLFTNAIRAVAADPNVGLVAMCFTPPNNILQTIDIALPGVAAGARGLDKPVVIVTTALKNSNDYARAKIAEHDLPFVFGGLDHAMRAFGKAAWWSAQLQNIAPPLLQAAQPANLPRPATERQALDFLAGFGVPVIPAIIATTAEAAGKAAASLGGTVVMKILSPDIAHKTEIGGVRLGLKDPAETAAAFDEMIQTVRTKAPNARLEGVIISPMRGPGLEIFVGAARDPVWGPVIAVGLGGVWVEALADTATSLLPVTPAEVIAMLKSLRGEKLLEGFRGAPAADLAALAAVIAKIGDAALALGPDLVTLEINPLRVAGPEVEALDALTIWADAPHKEQKHG
jgi:acyl-CoA synthetase (NDP forming)